MSLFHLVVREIRMRKLNFALATLSVLIAVGVLVSQLALLSAHDARTDEILAARQAETEAEMDRLEDDYRKIMKKLGFNLVILPEGQQLSDFHAEGFAAKDMPEEYVKRLADSGIVTVRHLLPSLERKIRWPEQGQRSIIIAGTRGEVPLTHRKPKEPILEAVPPGKAVVGNEIADSLDFAPGDTFELMGRTFEVARVQPQRGTRDDITIWVDLATAQQMLDMEGRISAIQALKCHCQGADLTAIREQINGVLPGAKVIELSGKVVTRAEARDRAKAAALAALAAEKQHRQTMRAELEGFAAWVVPLVIVGAAAWIGILSWSNVRERRGEIGILRAIGWRGRQISTVFLVRAALVGVVGAVLGYGLGALAGATAADMQAQASRLVAPTHVMMVLVAAPVLTLLASWPPAVWAARQDPAVVLREE